MDILLETLEIKDLFGVKGNNKNINFKENLTILVGKNGSGKTSSLDILNCILTNSYLRLMNHDFSFVRLTTSIGDIAVEKTSDRELAIKSFLLGNLNELVITDNNVDELSNEFDKLNSLYFPTFRRVETDFLELYNSINHDKTSRFIDDYAIFGRRFINELSTKLSEQSGIILGLSNRDINSIVAKKWNEYNEFEKERLNDLIKNFFLSLVQTQETQEQSVFRFRKLRNSRKIIDELQNLFVTAGYIEKDDHQSLHNIEVFVETVDWANNVIRHPEEHDDNIENISKALKLMNSYEKVEDLLQMYREAHKEISEKKSHFENLTNTLSKFLNKSVMLDDGKLIFIKDNNNIVEYEDLSAGEKQLVALFVYTQLALKKNSIVIIDEPELSLHINWQRNFLKALTNGEKNIQYVVSTHSPFIISSFSDNIVELGDLGVVDNEYDF